MPCRLLVTAADPDRGRFPPSSSRSLHLQAVAVWAKSHGLPDESVKVLQHAASVRATQQRIIPAIKLDVRVGGVPQELLLYSGDNITEAVQSFVRRHGLGEADSRMVNAAIHERAVNQRMVPEHVIPVEVEGDVAGEVTAAKDLLIFKVRSLLPKGPVTGVEGRARDGNRNGMQGKAR